MAQLEDIECIEIDDDFDVDVIELDELEDDAGAKLSYQDQMFISDKEEPPPNCDNADVKPHEIVRTSNVPVIQENQFGQENIAFVNFVKTEFQENQPQSVETIKREDHQEVELEPNLPKADETFSQNVTINNNIVNAASTLKRPRGRPRKDDNKPETQSEKLRPVKKDANKANGNIQKNPRGRPRKEPTDIKNATKANGCHQASHSGKPTSGSKRKPTNNIKKVNATKANGSNQENHSAKPRGRPRKELTNAANGCNQETHAVKPKGRLRKEPTNTNEESHSRKRVGRLRKETPDSNNSNKRRRLSSQNTVKNADPTPDVVQTENRSDERRSSRIKHTKADESQLKQELLNGSIEILYNVRNLVVVRKDSAAGQTKENERMQKLLSDSVQILNKLNCDLEMANSSNL